MIDVHDLPPSPALNARTHAGSLRSGGDQHDSRRARSRAQPAWSRGAVEPVLPAAYDLLSAVLSSQREGALSVVQFLPFGGHGCARLVPAVFAAASAAAFGRTLLLDVSGPAEIGRRQNFGSVPADADPLTLRRTMTPDITRPGLHHAVSQPRCAADLHDLAAKVGRSTAGQASPFRMIVLDEALPLAREHSLMLSRACTATVAVAIAGHSRQSEMRETLRRLRTAGATVAGLVLIHEPGDGRAFGSSDQTSPQC